MDVMEIKDNDKFLDGIYRSQENFEADEPEGLWAGIESVMSERDKAAIVPLRRRLVPLWAGLSAAVAASVALAIVFRGPGNAVVLPDTDTDVAVAVVAPDKTAVPDNVVASDDSAVFGGAAAPAMLGNNLLAEALSSSASAQRRLIEKGADTYTADDTAPEIVQASNDVGIGNEEVDKEESNGHSEVAGTAVYKKTAVNVVDEPSSKGRTGSKFALSASASSVTGSRGLSAGYSALSNSDVVRQTANFSTMGKEYSQVLLSNNNSDVSTETRHFQPVRFAVTASYQFNRVISLESGLSYSFLLSSLSSGSDNGRYTTRQQLHYLGIPLNIRLNMWEIHNFSVYFSGGGMMEKCVAGKSVTKYSVAGVKGRTTSSSLKEKQLQWSLNGAFGAQYRFNKLVGLYVEPGVSYYFNNGSYIENIYKERPLNFNISLGLRFCL